MNSSKYADDIHIHVAGNNFGTFKKCFQLTCNFWLSSKQLISFSKVSLMKSPFAYLA